MCNCAETANKALVEKNAVLVQGFSFADGGMKVLPILIAIEKLDRTKRGRLPSLVATFCPFCGKKYPQVVEGEPP